MVIVHLKLAFATRATGQIARSRSHATAVIHIYLSCQNPTSQYTARYDHKPHNNATCGSR